jgi:hypothetical protein
MAKAKLRMPAPSVRIEERPPATETAADVLARSDAAPWWVAFIFLGVLAILLVWQPITRIQAHYQINYNEGWNSYPQQLVANGGRVYGSPPGRQYWNYPPVSFHVVGWLAKITHDVNLTGRWVSFLAFLAIAVLTGMTVHRLTGSRRSGAFAAIWVVIFIGALKSERIGMNDPHMLGMALIALGFYGYVRSLGEEDPLWLRISAVAFVVGLFTKHTLLAFPIAAAVHLLLTSTKRLISWIITGAIAAAVLLVATFALDGSHFFEHLMFPRVYSYAFFLSNTVWYLLMFQTAIIVCLMWCFRTGLRSNEGVLLLAYAAATGMAFWVSWGAGADLNHLFDPAVSMALIGGVALPYAVWASERVRFRKTALATLLIVPFSLGALTMLPPRIQEDSSTARSIPQAEQEFASAVEFVKSRPGPALCEYLLVCFEAGKPEEYDAYEVDQLIKTGKLPEQEILKLLDDRHFATILLRSDADHPIAPEERTIFTRGFMIHLLNDYKVAANVAGFALFVPNR